MKRLLPFLLLLLTAAAVADNETRPFAPIYGPSSGTTGGSLLTSTTVAALTTHVASAQFAGGSGVGAQQIQIANLTTSWAYVQFGVYGNVTISTVATGYPVAPGAVVVVTVNPEVTGADVILDSSGGTGNVIFTRGAGI